MESPLKHISIKALAIAFFGCYLLPVLLGSLAFYTFAITSDAPDEVKANRAVQTALLGIGWMSILAPLAAGYLVAKLAGNIPLLHALIISGVGLAFFGAFVSGRGGGWWVIWIALNVSCSLFGARLWRYRTRGVA